MRGDKFRLHFWITFFPLFVPHGILESLRSVKSRITDILCGGYWSDVEVLGQVQVRGKGGHGQCAPLARMSGNPL